MKQFLRAAKRGVLLVLAALMLAALAGCLEAPKSTAPAPEPTAQTVVTATPAPESTDPATEPPATAPPEATEEPTAEPTPEPTELPTPEPTQAPAPTPDENGSYNSKEDVALYIHLYGHLPSNYISKKDAEKLGWSGGSLEKYAPGKSIGGSRFGNYEGILPNAPGRTFTECDIDTLGAKSRGAKRIVFSNDGLVYYTEDHYETFELLYGEE